MIDKEKEENPGEDSRKTMSDKEDQEKPAKEHLAHNSGSVSVPTMQRQVAFWSSHGWSLTTKRQTIFFIRKGVNYVLLFRLLRTFSLKKQNKKNIFYAFSNPTGSPFCFAWFFSLVSTSCCLFPTIIISILIMFASSFQHVLDSLAEIDQVSNIRPTNNWLVMALSHLFMTFWCSYMPPGKL